MASTYHLLGRIAQEQGYCAEADKWFQICLEIENKECNESYLVKWEEKRDRKLDSEYSYEGKEDTRFSFPLLSPLFFFMFIFLF
ncbi:MAG: hypothetical protein R2941_24810 [Desulfobacterales bacterium]